MNVNPFDKKARVRDYLYNTKRRQEILSKVNNDEMLNELDKNVLARYNKKIAELDKCASEKEQFKDLDRAVGKGVMSFKWKGSEYYNAIKAIILGESGAGKSYLMTSLLFEINNSFESITLFSPESTYQNECYQCIVELCDSIGMKFFWVDSCQKDFDIHNYVPEPSINDDHSCNELYDNTFGSIWIFDDIYNSHTRSSWIQKLYSEAFIRLRHRRINTFVLLQGASYLDSELVNNYSHVFMSSAFVNKGEEMFKKLHTELPENMGDVMESIKQKDTSTAKHTFWYFKNGETHLQEYIPLNFSSKAQIKQKLKFKLPKPLRQSKRKGEGIDETKKKLLIESFDEFNPSVKESKPVEAAPNKPISVNDLELAIKPRKKVRSGNIYYYVNQ